MNSYNTSSETQNKYSSVALVTILHTCVCVKISNIIVIVENLQPPDVIVFLCQQARQHRLHFPNFSGQLFSAISVVSLQLAGNI